jgi:hypothetical protein
MEEYEESTMYDYNEPFDEDTYDMSEEEWREESEIIMSNLYPEGYDEDSDNGLFGDD